MEPQNINESAEKKQKNVQAGVASGLGAAAGAGIGVAAATFATQAAAAKSPDEEPELTADEAAAAEAAQQQGGAAQGASHGQQSTTHHQQQTAHKAEQQPAKQEPAKPEEQKEPEPKPEDDKQDDDNGGQKPTPGDDDEPTVEVVAYETIDNEDGTLSDIAVVAVDGTPVVVADIDRDGMADLMAVDINENGSIEDEEIIDVSDSNIAMEPLQQAAGVDPDLYVASNDESDYINDANVDDFIA